MPTTIITKKKCNTNQRNQFTYTHDEVPALTVRMDCRGTLIFLGMFGDMRKLNTNERLKYKLLKPLMRGTWGYFGKTL